RDLKTIADDYAVLIIDAVNKANSGRITTESALENVEQAKKRIEDKWGKYTQTQLTQEEAKLVKEAENLFINANKSIDQLLSQLRQMRGTNANTLSRFDGPLYDTIDPISEKITELVELQLDVASFEREKISQNYKSIKQSTILIGFITLLVILTFNLMNYRTIHRTLQNLTHIMSLVAKENNLTIQAEVSGPLEFAEIATNLNNMLSQMNMVMKEIDSASQQLKKTSDEIVMISKETTSSVYTQDEQVSNISLAMTTLLDCSKNVSENAENAAKTADNTMDEAMSGQNIVERSVEATQQLVNKVADIDEDIRHLDKEVQSIESVVSVISDIADQTNLLALNAAIEAARAGEQGRGFAVVADEVRTLANRTITSTTEIQTSVQQLLQGTSKAVESIEESSQHANDTGDKAQAASTALSTIQSAVVNITDINRLIATASEEQDYIIKEIHDSIQTIQNASKKTSNSADGLNMSSELLLKLAVSLNKMTSAFKVK
ncbi:MAG: methyl-accepting chemotaxis protein, partial [Shewanellaceae bacterium]|nr:methyl-accepting chemotaxis protein [Shewanellaceae bacterium]